MNLLNQNLFLLFIILNFNKNSCENISLEEKTIKGKNSKKISSFSLIHKNLGYEFVKIKIEPSEHKELIVFANYNTLNVTSLSNPEVRFIGYNPLFYFDMNNNKNISLQVFSDYSDYEIKYQGISSQNIELYDNYNFTLNTLTNKEVIIKYIPQLNDLSVNYIIVSITSPSLSDFYINAKYKGNDIKVNQLFPYSKTIIISSSTLSNYSKGETLFFSYYSLKNTMIKISSRIINLKDKNSNEALTELKLFETYFTVLGGYLNITKECFYINEKYYNKNSTFSISSYSYYGVLLSQVDNNYKSLENQLLIIDESNYYSYNGSVSDKFCIETLSPDFLTGIHFQVIDMNELMKNQYKINQLIRQIPLKFYLEKDQLIYYPLDKFNISENDTFSININISNGNPEIGYGYCIWYPLNCSFNAIDSIEKGISESNKINLTNNTFVVNNQMIGNNIFFTKLILIKCPSEKCEYTLISYRNHEIDYIQPSSEILFFKLNEKVYANTVNNHIFNINQADIRNIFIVINSIFGNVDLKVIKDGIVVGKYDSMINKEIVHIDKINNEELIGFYIINIKSTSIAEYTLYYYITNQDLKYIKYIEAGLIEEQSITFLEKNKTFLLLNPYKLNGKNYLVMINSLNCRIKATFNEVKYTNKQNQIIIDSNDPFYDESDYPVDIELLSLDSGNLIQNEKCILYIGGFELNEENPIKLNEGIYYSFVLSEEVKKLTFYYEYKLSKEEDESENINLLFDKHSQGKLNITASLYSETNDYEENTNKEEKSLILTDSNSFNILILNRTFLIKGCQDSNCKIILTIESLTKDKNISFDFEIIGENQTPYYIPDGEMFLDIIKVNKYQYYYCDIKTNSYGEIVFNFKQGSVSVIGRIIRKNETDENPTFNNRIRLPLITDLTERNDVLEFDYYNQKIIFTEEDTKDCDKSGCQIFIGVLVDIEDYQMNNLLVDYSLYMRYDGQEVILKQDEYVFGSLSINEVENEMDYYQMNIIKNSNKIIIEFDSELCDIYVKKNGGKATKDNYDFLIQSNNSFYEIESQINDNFSFGVSNINLKGYFSSFYYFKVMIPDINEYPLIQKLGSAKNEYCIIDNSNIIKKKCLFVEPLYSYYLRDITYYFYSINEDYPESKIEIFIDEIPQNDFEMNENKINLFPSSNDKKTSGNLAYYYNENWNSEKYLLITVKCNKSGKILFLSNSRRIAKSIYLYPNSKQLFNIEGQKYKFTNQINLNMMKENNMYYVELVALNGTGLINSTNIHRYITSNLSEKHLPSIGGVYKASYYLNIDVNKFSSFVYYVNNYWRSNTENLDKIEIDRINYINYLEDLNLKLFPMSFYFYFKEDEYNDIQINFKIELNDTKKYSSDNLTVKAYIVDETYILKRKLNLDKNINNYDFIEEIGYLNDTLSGSVIFLIEDIKNFKCNRKVLFFELFSSKYNYTNVTIKIEKTIPSNVIETDIKKEIKVPMEKGIYFISTVSKTKINVLKFKKKNKSDKSMKIQLSINEGFIFYYTEYDLKTKTFENINLIKTQGNKIENERKYGKYIFKLNNLNSQNEGVIIYIFCDNDNLRNFNIEKDNKYVSIKYESFQNSLIPETSLKEYSIINQHLIINNLNDSIYSVSISPIILNGEIINNIDYFLNLFFQSDYSNPEDIDKIYSGEPKYSYSNYKLEKNSIIFIINDTEKGDYYINVLAIVNDDDGDILVYTPTNLSIPFKTKNINTNDYSNINDTTLNTFDNYNNEKNIIGKKKIGKGYSVTIIIIFVFVIVGILLFIFRKILFKRKRVILYNNDFNSQTDFKINDKEFIDDFNIKDKGGKVKIELSDKQSESNTLF